MIQLDNSIFLILALLAGLLVGWLFARLQAAQTLRLSREEGQQQREQLLQQLARMESQLDAERSNHEEKVQLLNENRSALEKNFQTLSSQALNANNENFLTLAKEKLDNHQQLAKHDLESRQQAIGQLVQPLIDSLVKVDSRIGQLEQARSGAYARLDEQLKGLLDSQVRLQSETGNLVKALRAPSVRGRWGEIQLRKVVEMAGMVNYCDFLEQETADSGRLRPDMVIKLPNSRNIVVDSKAPLQAYLESLEATDERQQKEFLQQHARQVRDHLQKLSTKNYWEQFQPTPEFVVLFLPGETFFSAALEQDPGLIEAGVDQKVLLATPTTLIALLRSVAYGWRQEQLTEHATTISRLGREMYDRLATMNQHFQSMGKNLERAVDSYNKGVSSLDTRVMVSARKFKELGSGSSKEIAPLEQLDKQPRIPAADEDPQ